jgi:hypothetical protein
MHAARRGIVCVTEFAAHRFDVAVHHGELMPRRFTPEQVQRIEEMVAAGHTSVVIAKQIGCKPSAVRSKCASMGLTLRRPKPDYAARFSIPKHAFAVLVHEAAARGMSPNRLAGKLLTIFCEDEMIGTMIDNLVEVPAIPDEPAVAPTATVTTVPVEPAPISITMSLTAIRCPQLTASMP